MVSERVRTQNQGDHDERSKLFAGRREQPRQPDELEQLRTLGINGALAACGGPGIWDSGGHQLVWRHPERAGGSAYDGLGEEVMEDGGRRVLAPALFNMPQTFTPPLSGPILGLLIDAFDLRRLDRAEVLTKRNSRRYLAGERLSADAEEEVHAAFAEAVVEAGLLPPGLNVADLLETGPPKGAVALVEVPLPAFRAVAVGQYARHWDTLARALRRPTAPVAHPRHAAGACVRLVVIDLAIRFTSLLWLARVQDERPMSEFWFEPDGLNKWLRSLVRMASPEPSREIAKEVEIHTNTVDGWLGVGESSLVLRSTGLDDFRQFPDSAWSRRGQRE